MSRGDPRRAPPEEARHHNEAMAADAAEQDRWAFLNTSNVLYLWRAIDAFGAVNRDRERAGEAPLPLPVWITAELGVQARRIMDVAAGMNWRDTPQPFGTLTCNADALDRARARKVQRDPERAVKDAVQALGFQSMGANAFDA